ncbi:MAG: hypothetical protein IJK77_09435 [Lachnospiraceae bacterium]|nr:hypothetical protein [Lachnospiraceae bacterium]
MKHLSRIFALILAVLVFCTGCGSSVSPEKYSTTAAATYGDQTTYLDEANFWLRLNQWSTESYTGMMYYYYYGITDIWSQPSGNRTQTYEQSLKENVMAEILQTYILLDHAGEYSAELTDEENHKIDHLIEDLRDSYADEFFTLAGIAEGEAGDKQLRTYFEKRVKAFKVAYAVMQAADVTVNDDDCKSFRIAYILVPESDSTTTASTESTGSTEASADEKKGQDLADLILYTLNAGEKWEDMKSRYSGLSSSESAFAYNDTETTSFLYTEGKGMKTGESKIYQREGTGWYVLHCISDDDAEGAESKRATLVAEQQDKAFNELYKTWQDAAKTFKVTKEFKNLKVEPSYVTKTTTAEPTTEAPSTEAPASEAETTTAAVK